MLPSVVRNLKMLAHQLLDHHVVVGSFRKDADPGLSSVRHEIVIFVDCHPAARASLLNVSRQLEDPNGASSCEMLERTRFMRTTDVPNEVNIIWANIYTFQGKDATRQEALWSLIRAVLDR